MDASVLVASDHCNDMVELAPRVGALMLAVEHRYYGDSMPVEGASYKNLKWLSSQQALADLATFHGQIMVNYSLTSSNKWVAFGGSYPGMMAGFFRLKYPHLVHAAVSSSSPWLAKLDMNEYQDVVGDSLTVQGGGVGGSAACKQVVVDGHETIAGMITTSEGRETLAEQFGFCDPSTALVTEEIAGQWAGAGVIEVPSQENDPSCSTPACDIGSICSMLLNGTSLDNVEKLAMVSEAQHDGRCIKGWSEDAIAEAVSLVSLTSPSSAGRAMGSARSWPYQTCTEFAFYQTCEVGSRCPFVKGYNTLDDMIAMCDTLFGISPDAVAEQVAFSNACYGGDAPQGTRILFPNGDVDPWHGLGVLEAPSDSEPVMMVAGASHHFWTHPQNQITQSTVQAAKTQIQDQVISWLEEE